MCYLRDDVAASLEKHSGALHINQSCLLAVCYITAVADLLS